MGTGGSVRRAILSTRLREYVLLDSTLYRVSVALAGFLAGIASLVVRQRTRALKLLSAVHRAGYVPRIDEAVERIFVSAYAGGSLASPLVQAAREYIHGPLEAPRLLAENPDALLGPLVMVLRSPDGGRKGVLLLQYNYVFPLFMKHFDVARVAERYHIVLEPSWSGYCNPEVLCYAGVAQNVFVQAFEPRDQAFMRRLNAGFVVVPTSTNWWVDHRVFTPLPGVTKDVDVVMVAAWGTYKRHIAFFEALRRLKRMRPSIRVVLVGYDLGLSIQDIRAFAHHFGVADTIECFEGLTQAQVNEQLNRARVNVIWSRKEGVNRAIVEGMFANVPCVIREGFNYGHRYEYVNAETGAFATEEGLPGTILSLIDRHDRIRPRDWVMEHMSCQRSTEILRSAITQSGGEDGAVAVKVNGLHGMEYWDGNTNSRFTTDYAFLRELRK